jgi:uncharacterized protein with PIN domain
MKINLTIDEVKLMLTNHPDLKSFGLGTIDIIIEDVTPKVTAGMNYVEAICRITRQFPLINDMKANQKIPAIKALRTLVTGLSLAEAKIAVESPDEAITHYIRFGKPLTY